MLNEKKASIPQPKKILTQQELLSRAMSHSILEMDYESVFIFGPPKTGKTWCYMSYIDKIIKDGGKVHLLCTDAGVTKTYKAYFKERMGEVAKSINFYMMGDLNQIYAICNKIKSDVFENKLPEKPSKDLIVVDLISDFWELGQVKFVEDTAKGNPIDYMIQASNDPAKFGLFDSTKWQYIKLIENCIIKNLIIPPICNVIGIASEKDIAVEKIKSKSVVHKFDITGAKPAGSKGLPYYFNSFIYVNDNANKRYFQVLGHRGANIDGYKHNPYTDNFWEDFQNLLKKA